MLGRAALESLSLFFAPFALFSLYLILRARYPLEMEHWTRGRVSLLTLAGLALAVAGVLLTVAFAPRGRGTYVPAHIENGVLVQGRFE